MKLIKKYKIYLINIFVVLGMFLLILLIGKVSPFGTNILGKSDSIAEFKPMLFNFITKLRTGTLLNYSFNNGLGNPFIFDFIYHLASPLNLIAIFFKSPDEMFLSTIMLKLMVGSIIMTYYVSTKTNNKYIIFIATISYMFSSWMVTYYYYLPWLDVFILFPLLQIGLDKLFDKNKPTIYIVALALITICNFYLAFSVYIYVIFYFIIRILFYDKNTFKEKILQFDKLVLYTLLTFCFIFIYLYILFDVYKKTGMSIDSVMGTNYIVTFKDFIKSLLYGNSILTTEMYGETFPNIACNHFILINCLYFFLNNNISKRNKIFALIAGLIILCSIFVHEFDFTLNFFHHIRGLTYRYSFIIIFLGIWLFIYNIIHLEKIDRKKLILIIGLILLLIIISFKRMELNIVLFNIISLILYFIILFVSNKKILFIPLCIIVIIQSLIIGYEYIPIKQTMEEQNYDKFRKENVTYRTNISEGYKEEVFNHNLYLNSKVTHLLSAMNYNNTIKLASMLGCNSFSNSSMYCSNKNRINNLLFNVKDDSYYLEKIFAVNDSLKTIPLEGNIKDLSENIIYAMTGIKDIYNKETLKGTIQNDKYEYIIDYDSYLLDDGNYISFKTSKKIVSSSSELDIYVIDYNKLNEVYEYLKGNQIEYSFYDDNHIEGSIHVNIGQMIYTSIPYDESWEIMIDNKIVKPVKILDSLIGIKIDEGDHTIVLKYKNNYYLIPLIISISSMVIYVVIRLIKRKKADTI